MTNFIEIIGPYDIVAKKRKNVINHHTYDDENKAREAFSQTVASGTADEIHLFRSIRNGNEGVQRLAYWER